MNEIASGLIQRDLFWMAIGAALIALFILVGFLVIWIEEIKIKKKKRKNH